MRILYLTHRIPYPPNNGEKIRALNVLKHLARSHEVHLGCLVDDPADLAHVGQLGAYVRGVVFQRMRPAWRKLLALPSVFGPRSLTVTCFHSWTLQRQIDNLIEREQFDAVLCSSSPMAEYLFRSRRASQLQAMRRVMDLIDVDSSKWRAYAERSPRWMAWIYRHEARTLATFERRIAREFDRVLVVSSEEKRYFPAQPVPERLGVMPNGVDLEFFSPTHPRGIQAAGPILVFTGVMSYHPNIEGIVWFAERILPRVQQVVPGATLYIVGSRPARPVRRLGRRAGIVATGFVEDVREYLAAASVCVVPLRIARGIQNKILEAMAMARPVVATQQAFEGLDAKPGRDLLVADGEEAFAAAVIELLSNETLRVQIGRDARSRVEQCYSWAANLQVLDELFPPAQSAMRRVS